jgi:hypothetical protein
MQEVLSFMLHDDKSPPMVMPRLENGKPLRNALYESLFWVTISRIRWTSIPELQESCNAWHPWGSINTDSSRSEVEEIAYTLIYPKSIEVERLSSRLSFSTLGALGASLSQFGHLHASMVLLELSLRAYEKAFVSSSIAYGVLFAGLLKNYNKSGRSREARMMRYEYLKRPYDSLPADRSDRIYIMIATSDACIALREYGEASKLLSDVLSRSDLDAYNEVCSALRLNKVWRRRRKEEWGQAFAEKLSRVLSLTSKENALVQEEFFTELQATAYHTKQAQEPLSPPLRAIVHSTLQLYQRNYGAFHESLATLDHLNQMDVTTVPFVFDIDITDTRPYNRTNAAAHEASDVSFNSICWMLAPLIPLSRSLQSRVTAVRMRVPILPA